MKGSLSLPAVWIAPHALRVLTSLICTFPAGRLPRRRRGHPTLLADLPIRTARPTVCSCPCSAQSLQVSCFGDDSTSDSGDMWRVEWDGAAPHWERDAAVRLLHRDTAGYLSNHAVQYQRPIPGHTEVRVGAPVCGWLEGRTGLARGTPRCVRAACGVAGGCELSCWVRPTLCDGRLVRRAHASGSGHGCRVAQTYAVASTQLSLQCPRPLLHGPLPCRCLLPGTRGRTRSGARPRASTSRHARKRTEGAVCACAGSRDRSLFPSL